MGYVVDGRPATVENTSIARLQRLPERAQKVTAVHALTNSRPPLPLKKIVTGTIQRYWRVSRGLTLGAQGCVLDAGNRILLIRHTYRPGWHFPGGGVEKGETLENALARELDEEAGIRLEGRPKLFGIYANDQAFPGDHIALFVVRSWSQPRILPPNREIAEQNFYSHHQLPRDIHHPTADRIKEVIEGRAPSELW